MKSLLVGFFLSLAIIILAVMFIPGHLGVDFESKMATEMKPWIYVIAATSQVKADQVVRIKFHGPQGQDFSERNPDNIRSLLDWMRNAKTISQIPVNPNWDVRIVLKGKKVIGPFAFNSRSWMGTFGSQEFYTYLMRKIQHKQ